MLSCTVCKLIYNRSCRYIYLLISRNWGGKLESTDVGNITLKCAVAHMLSLRGWLCNNTSTFTYHRFNASSYINKQLKKNILVASPYHGYYVMEPHNISNPLFLPKHNLATILLFRHDLIMILASFKVFPTIYHSKQVGAPLDTLKWRLLITDEVQISYYVQNQFNN